MSLVATAPYLGDFAVGSTVIVPFTTRDGSGGRVEPNSAFEAADVIVYKNGSATQRTSESGYTVTSPFDSLVGVQLLTIDLSDDADSGFYTGGSDYTVVLYPDETVDTQSISEVLCQFSIENRSNSLSAAALANLEDQFDGTGYAHDTAPATQIQVAGLSGGLAVQATAGGSVVTQGAETNTFADTATNDGTEYIVTDSEAGVGIDFYLQFDLVVEAAVPVNFHMDGYFEDQGAPDKTIAIQVFNWNTSAWQTVETLVRAAGEETHEVPLNIHQVQGGIVRVRFLQSASESGNAMHIDHCTVGYVTSLQVDSSGFIKVSSGTGTGQLNVTSGVVDANTTQVGGVTVTKAELIPHTRS